MKRLLLASAGFCTESLQKKAKDLFEKEMKDVKIMYFDTASKPEEDKEYLKDELDWIYATGVRKDNLTRYEMTSDITEEEILKYDAIWVSGGNTYYLLDTIRKTGLDEKLAKALEKGVLYMGASAGSMVATVNIDVTYFMDNNFLNLQDLKGMDFFHTRIIPHKRMEWEKGILECKEKIKEDIIVLTDEEAVYVEGYKYSIIS
ncbi:MAG: hypothetical protein A2Y24_01445 [Clostridiales bacterium GWE2_32_10]|nr:MAG: hypothetical protein A2Y24_01445 [Clostridiales bacterium GWE2_32_10]HBY19994.1 hypothetical protein [Clostridiales bacterium]